nr:MerR family DNA-binding transcriptional regulator [Lactiplantibacillus pentosus]
MNIKQASEQTGVSSAAIRYYEKEGLIPAIDRSETGNREIGKSMTGLFGGSCLSARCELLG